MSTGRAAAVLAVVVLLGVAPAATTGAGGADAARSSGADATTPAGTAPTEITDCTTITEPGEYVLADDLTNGSPTRPRTGLGACIDVRADDVLLDGADHTIAAGPNGTPGVVGVLVSPQTRARGALLPGVLVGARASPSNVTVRNLTTTRWGAGVAIIGAENATLLNVSAVRNLGDGFFVENAPGATVRGGVVRESNTGVFVRNAPDARVADLTVEENLAGVSVRRSDGATVAGVNASRNSQFGVGVFSSANVTLADSALRANDLAGVALAGAEDARLRNLTMSSDATQGWAMYAVNDSTAVGERVRLGETTISFEASDVALDSADGAPPLPLTERQVVGSPLFALPTDAEASLSLSVRYTDAAVERASTTEDSLSLWRFDAGEGWRHAPTTLDADRNAASATFGSLNRNGTIVALVGEGLAEAGNGTEAQSVGSVETRYYRQEPQRRVRDVDLSRLEPF